MAGRTKLSNDETLALLQNKLGESWTEFLQIWKSFGYNEDTVDKRKRTIVRHLNDLFADMIGEEYKRVTEKEKQIDDLIKEIERLVKELELDPISNPLKDFLLDTTNEEVSVSLLDKEFKLGEIVAELRKSKEVRMEKYNKINAVVERLNVKLGESPYPLDFFGIPSDAQVEELNRHCLTLQQEEKTRLQRYVQLSEKLKQHFVNLEKIPANQLEKTLITGKPEPVPVPLSVAVMKEIEALEVRLKAQIAENKMEADGLWQKIRDLWKRLKTPEDIMTAFENIHRFSENEDPKSGRRKSKITDLIAKPSLISGLQRELYRLEEEKKENIASFIQELRVELGQLWEKCFAEDESGTKFLLSTYIGDGGPSYTELDLISNLYSEELLEKHEQEVEKWRKYYEDQKKLIEGVAKRQEMWTKWLELDIKSDDPARLSNRGGALLKEEKDRKALEKSIPKLEKDLIKLSLNHQEIYSIKFIVYGEEISQKIDREWSDFHEEKEARKTARKKPGVDDAKSVMMTTMVGPPGSRKRPAPQTPSSTIVNKDGQTPKRGKMLMTTPKSPYGHRAAAPHVSNTKNPPVKISKTGMASNSKAAIAKSMAIADRPPKPPIKKLPGVALVQKYRKSMSRNRGRYVTGNNSLDDSDKTLSIASVDSFRGGQSTFSPVIDIHTLSQLDFNKNSKSSHESLIGTDSVIEFGNIPRPREVGMENQRKTKPTGRFVTPTARSIVKKPVVGSGAAGRKLRKSLRLQNQEQLPDFLPLTPGKSKALVSPVSTYSEFSKDLLGQSTLNSSVATHVLSAAREPLSNIGAITPTRSRNMAPRMTPAKNAIPHNKF